MYYNHFMDLNFKNFIIALAPMAGVTDFAFRKICADFGADMVVTEMISLKAFEHNSKLTEKMLREESNAIRGCQVFFHDPEIAQLISNERVLVNFEICTKPSKLLNFGDIITIRGKGRFELNSLKSTSKSGNLIVIIYKYV